MQLRSLKTSISSKSSFFSRQHHGMTDELDLKSRVGRQFTNSKLQSTERADAKVALHAYIYIYIYTYIYMISYVYAKLYPKVGEELL